MTPSVISQLLGRENHRTEGSTGSLGRRRRRIAAAELRHAARGSLRFRFGCGN